LVKEGKEKKPRRKEKREMGTLFPWVSLKNRGKWIEASTRKKRKRMATKRKSQIRDFPSKKKRGGGGKGFGRQCPTQGKRPKEGCMGVKK